MILKDKVVIVTGAGPGMGQAACRGAAREGAKVVVTARSKAAIEAVAHREWEAIAPGRRMLGEAMGRVMASAVGADGLVSYRRAARAAESARSRSEAPG
jgi:NAD(P)-dependent dehydrogenase (short-subunit alcohol dehydrogenase family)